MKGKNVFKILKKVFFVFLGFNALLIIIGLIYPLEKKAQSDNLVHKEVNLLSSLDDLTYYEYQISNLVNDTTNDSRYGDVYCFDKFKPRSLKLKLKLEASGTYYLVIDYLSLQTSVSNISLNFDMDGVKKENILLDSFWQDEDDLVKYDIYNNQVQALQLPYQTFKKTYLYDQQFYDLVPLNFELEAGLHDLEIEVNKGEFLLGNLYLVLKEDLKKWDESFKTDVVLKDEVITLEGEKPIFKNDTSIQASAITKPNLHPFSTKHKMLNVLSGDSFNKSGFNVTYAFEVLKEGNYEITFKYANTQANTYSYLDIYLDNQILSEEMVRYPFKGSQKYLNETLKNKEGKKLSFPLSKGVHTLTLRIDAGLQSEIYFEMYQIIEEISSLYLEVLKLTGGENDPNKKWDIKKYIPDAESRLQDWCLRLENLLDLIDDVSKVNKKKANTLAQYVSNSLNKLKKLAKNPNSLPHRLNILSTSTSSASSLLSQSLHTSTFSPISIDRIYLHSSDKKMKTEKSNFFLEYFSTVQRIFKSGMNLKKEDVLNVWVNRSTYYVSSMQKFSDAYYTPKSKQKVRFSLLPDESKLTYAYAAKTQPDVALGVSSLLPYDLGIRGALCDLKEFKGFNEVIKDMAPGALINLGCDKHIYGIPETQDFNIMYYRKDLLMGENGLGLELPNTWDDVIKMLPTLERFGMNFYIPMAGGAGLKSISTTAPFIYQYGGKLYNDDYLSVNIDSKEAIAAINLMVDLFQLYSLPLTSQNFYDGFRKGLMPIGINGFDMYLQLTTAAPEIAGKWGVALIPGVKNNEGFINRSSTGDTKNAVIFKGTKKKDAGFEFLKWWLSSDTQSRFASTIQATYGETFLWNTANLEAFKTLAIDDDCKKVILEQFNYLENIIQTPAAYMVERGLSNIWNRAVFDNQSVRSLITDSSIEINKEIKRKMQEFGYLDKNGKVLKPYSVYSVDEIKKMQKGGFINE